VLQLHWRELLHDEGESHFSCRFLQATSEAHQLKWQETRAKCTQVRGACQ